MATPNGFTYLSPGLYRSNTGQTVRRGQLPTAPKPSTPTTTAPAPTSPTYATTFRNAGNGYYRGADGKLISGGLMNTYTNRFNNAAKQFSGLKAGDANYNELGNNLKTWGARFGFDTSKLLGKDWKPFEAAPPPPPAPDTSATQPAPDAAPGAETPPPPPPVVGSQYADYQSPMTAMLMKAMADGVNTMQAYEPKSFEGSPLYQFQKQKGMQDMEKLMAARGLTGSGAEVQANSDFLVNLNAQESEKQRQYADQAAQRKQQAMEFIARFDQGEKEALRNQWNTDLDRQQNISQFEANRGDARQAQGINTLLSILSMQGQSNIGNNALSGLNQQTALTDTLQKMLGSFTANNYARSYGGGGGVAPVAPPSREADLARINADYGNRAGNNDLIDRIFRTFLGGS